MISATVGPGPRAGRRRGQLAVAAVLLATAVAGGEPPDRTGDAPAALIRRLYAAHQPWRSRDLMYRGDALDEGSLRLFLDQPLVGLLRLDDACKARTGDVGALDFDPFLDAQDYDDAGISDLAVRCEESGEQATCRVRFLGLPSDPASTRHLTYRLARRPEGWRVSDIAWTGRRETLRDLLSRPCGR